MRSIDNITALGNLMDAKAKAQVIVQTVWATCEKVAGDQMTATGILDGQDYHGVSLGLGALQLVPQLGSKCLLGLIENNPAQAFLIHAQLIESFSLSSGSLDLQVQDKINLSSTSCNLQLQDKINLANQSESLGALLDDLFAAISKMVFATPAGPTTQLMNASEFLALATRFKGLLK